MVVPTYRRLRRRLSFALTRLAPEEQRLARHGGDDRKLKRLGDEECRLRPLSGQEALGIGGDEDHRHLERAEKLVHGVEARAAVCELDVRQDQPRTLLTAQRD